MLASHDHVPSSALTSPTVRTAVARNHPASRKPSTVKQPERIPCCGPPILVVDATGRRCAPTKTSARPGWKAGAYGPPPVRGSRRCILIPTASPGVCGCAPASLQRNGLPSSNGRRFPGRRPDVLAEIAVKTTRGCSTVNGRNGGAGAALASAHGMVRVRRGLSTPAAHPSLAALAGPPNRSGRWVLQNQPRLFPFQPSGADTNKMRAPIPRRASDGSSGPTGDLAASTRSMGKA